MLYTASLVPRPSQRPVLITCNLHTASNQNWTVGRPANEVSTQLEFIVTVN